MKLIKFFYAEHFNTPRSWELREFEVNDVNLIVGANAAGKTRALNVIAGLSKLLLNSKITFANGTSKAHFLTRDNEELVYYVQLKNSNVFKEELFLRGEKLINRIEDGSGVIKGVEINRNINFKIPTNELAALRRDDLQHPFLNLLFDWASNLRHFRFAKEEEKKTLTIIDSDQRKKEEAKLKDTDRSIAIFNKGKKAYGDKFVKNIINDINEIGYLIENISLGPLESIQVDSPVSLKIVGLIVKEADREGITDQHSMSDGMFRALSIIIHFNYYLLTDLSGLVLIDDIGEGLDFERSTKLIRLLIKKSIDIGIQLIMSTNDKFVMNNTELEYWQIVHREGGLVRMHNISNSAEIFDQFRYTGLNNFDFYSTEFFKTGLK